MIIVLDHATLFHASPSRPTLDRALDQACSRYKSSNIHNTIKEHFTRPPKQYTVTQFTDFVLRHRL